MDARNLHPQIGASAATRHARPGTAPRSGVEPRRSMAAGFSLVELLLALALGLVVVTGIVQLFVGNSQSYAVLNGQARMQENGRFALEFIARAARSAGFFGCAQEPQSLVRGLTGGWNLIPEVDVTRPVMGFDGNAGGGWTPALTTLPRSEAVDTNVRFAGMGIDTRVIQPGTDVLVFRGVRAGGARLAEVLQPTGTPVIAAPGGESPIAPDDIVVVANCEQAAVVRVTDVDVAGNRAELALAPGAVGGLPVGPGEALYRNATTVVSPTGPIPFTLSFIGRAYGEDAIVSPVESNFFFIAPGLGVADDGQPPMALWQKVGTAAPVELVQGIEDLQVLFGIDTTLTDGVPNANRYVTAGNVPDVAQIVSVRVSVTANSVDAVDGGERLRRTLSKTLLVRNSNPEL
jgi:type IV pilus assembly protein PilW